LLQKYRQLLRQVEGRFRSIRTKHVDLMQCGQGCDRCGYGLFDISVLDSLQVAEGFRRLPEHFRIQVAERAVAVQNRLNREEPVFIPSIICNL
jgi:hypothetical protein